MLHVMDALDPSGPYSMAVDIAQYMHQWQHTLLFTSNAAPDPDMLVHAQGAGLDVLQTSFIDERHISELSASMAITYDVVVPSLEQELGTRCVRYAYSRTLPKGGVIVDTRQVPPMVNARNLRRLAGPPAKFTVAMLTSGRFGKYPCDLAMALMSGVKPGTTLMLTELPAYRHPGMVLALDAARKDKRITMLRCPVHPSGGVQYTVRADVLVYGTAAGYEAHYGRLVVEAMAMGKAVVVERKGVFGRVLEHGRQALLFDTPDEAVDHVRRLEKEPGLRASLGANAQLWASHEDISNHIGKLKQLFR